MRNLHTLNCYRRTDRDVIAHYGTTGDDRFGVFEVPSAIDRQPMIVIASSGDGWDHVSVSRRTRCPNWREREQVKRLFFRDDETAMQLHVPPAEHVSCHPFCLHLWRPLNCDIPPPPAEFVAPV